MAKTNDGQPLTDKELLNLHKMRLQRTQFLEFLLRQIANVTYQYNCFHDAELLDFAKAMAVGDEVRSQMKLKKNDQPRIWCFKTMLETCAVMTEQGHLDHANRLRTLLDLSGRMRVVANTAAEFVKILEKTGGDADYIDKARFYADHWKGFCLRTFDYSTLPMSNVELLEIPETEVKNPNEEAAELRLKYLPWPISVRTALYAACQYMRRVSLASGLKLFPDDPSEFRKYLQGPEFVTAFNIDDALFMRTQERRLSKMFGIKDLPNMNWRMPLLPKIKPKLMKCVDADGVLFVLPKDPITEPKKAKAKGGKKKK